MAAFIDEVTDQLNLRWAWEKVRRLATPGDNWFDEVEVAGFELELERNLRSIAKEFQSGRYRLTPLRPLPFPKDSDKDGNPRVRQVFQVAARDQVAWVALVNVIGPHVDSKMPPWSYGHRLFRSIWVEEGKDGLKRRKIGRYRHASGRLYLPFRQSWPVFRRHVYLSTRAMAVQDGSHLERLDEPTEEELEFQARMEKEHRCPFVMADYWLQRRPPTTEPKLYWCSIDLEKFYPTLNLDVVRANIVERLPPAWKDEANRTLASMLRFRLDLREWTANDLKKMDLRPKAIIFRHIPTGLYVAGFLANVALLKVDLQVAERLEDRRIAHFRFVDDHIMLAYSLSELVKWVREYTGLLSDSASGARINPEKVEPVELTRFLTGDKGGRTDEESKPAWEKAEKACRLDPRFPSPLMTKTLALVSAVARTDFNLLESEELAALTGQLEHLLLVDIPHEEIPEKTRLSFAATRLTQIAECRLANPEAQADLNRRRDTLRAELERLGPTSEESKELEEQLRWITRKLEDERTRLDNEVARAFQLLRKVLSERPDKTRLWTRALLMCRLTGVRGIADLLIDIRRERDKNSLAGSYLYANLLAMLGAQALIAARIVRDEGIAHWRRKAARAFLEDIRATEIRAPDEQKDRWFLGFGWLQYCFGLYCADLILKGTGSTTEFSSAISFPKEQLAIGGDCVRIGSKEHSPAEWVWWAARMTLRDLESHADRFVQALGNQLKPSRQTSAFWRFFPLDIPTPILKSMIQGEREDQEPGTPAGWWFDALRRREDVVNSYPVTGRTRITGSVRRALSLKRRDISLYEWCDQVRQMSHGASTDPRGGEWTALEIVRQIASLVSKEPTIGPQYISDARKLGSRLTYVHPANFRIPTLWIGEEEPTWKSWQELTRKSQVIYVPKSDRIQDNRYTPLRFESPLFRSVNPVRGLGLLLYGLLKKSFDLPAFWNGPGHADALTMLPKLLLAEMTCSSWTLGVLAGCLQPRVTENLFLLLNPLPGYTFEEDTLRDPFPFSDAKVVAKALEKCQHRLEELQLSTMNQRARQLTPVSIRQLTEPEWSKDFEFPAAEEGGIDG